MAFNSVIRSLPRFAQMSCKYYSGHSLTRSASILCPTKYYNSRIKHMEGSCVDAAKFPHSLMNKTIDLSQVKAFSVTSSNLSAVAHDHTKLWSAERILSAVLLGITPAAFMFPSPAMDTFLAITFVMHNHWGIEAVVIDYVRPIIFGTAIPKVALGLTYGLSIGMLVGLFYLIFNGTGLVNTIQLFWKL